MAQTTLKDIHDQLESAQRRSGFFDAVAMHEPKNEPGEGVTAATWLQRAEPARGASGLASTSVRIEVVTRLYTNMLSESADAIDPAVYAAADHLINAYSGDFDLGGTVRNVDLLGAHGEPLHMRAGYLRQGPVLYRVADIVTPIIVNDLWSQTA